MFAVGASTVSTNTEHYDFSLKVIQVLLVSKLFFCNSSCSFFAPLCSSNLFLYCRTPILALILHSNIKDC